MEVAVCDGVSLVVDVIVDVSEDDGVSDVDEDGVCDGVEEVDDVSVEVVVLVEEDVCDDVEVAV